MTRGRKSQGAATLLLTLAVAAPVVADERPGGGALMGWVEDTQGTPVSGAVISLFGKGIGKAGLVTFSDDAGRFFVASLPAGSYTLRALGRGHLPAPARQVTVLPNESSIFSVSLTPIGDLSLKEIEARTRELKWLLRHKARSVLEDQEPVRVAADHAPGTPDTLARLAVLGGTVEIMANPAAFGASSDATSDSVPSSMSVIRVGGRIADSAHWSLGGFVAESGGPLADGPAWRTAAEFSFHPGGGHQIEAGAGYGSPLIRPLALGLHSGHGDSHGVGAICLQDRWDIGPISSTVGARYSYVGYLADANHVDPAAALELRRDDGAILRGTIAARTLVPGGDPLTLSTLATGPSVAFAWMDGGLQAEKIIRYELAVDRPVGTTKIGAYTFYEGVRNQLVNAFDGPRSPRALHIGNAPGLASRGLGVSVARRFGGAVQGSVTYTYGRSWRNDPVSGSTGVLLTFRAGDFHDVVTRVETVIDRSDTRVVAFYRINTLSPDAGGSPSVTSSRFDVQLRQGLPFLDDLTRADWELLLAYRNLLYEAGEGATLDELSVVNPPKRVLGGLSVRF